MLIPSLLTACLLAQAPAPVAPPRLAFAPSGRVDLGTIGPREVKTVPYRLTNTSNAPIRLRVTALSPGVTVSGPALEQAIPAGEARPLVLQADPTGFVGWQARNVKLLTDDPGQGEYRLPIAMVIRPDLTVDAPRKSFGAVAPLTSPQLVFTFTRETGEPTSLKIVKGLPAYLDAEVEPEKGHVDLTLTLRPERIAPGVHQGLETLVVETNAPLQPSFTLYLDWSLAFPVKPTPARLVFLDPAEREKALTLTSTRGTAFRVLKATVEGGGFEAGALPASPAPSCTLTVRRTANQTTRALLSLVIEGQEEPLKVPLAFLPPS